MRAKTCRCSRCATCTGRMRLDDGLSWAQDLNDAWFAAASLAPRPFASCDPHNLNPSPTLIAPARHARHILAHTSSQTMSHRDLSLRSSRRLVPSAAIAWSRAWRPCATPNMTVPSSRWSPDRSSFCIVIFAASRTLAVRFQCSGAPQASSSCLVCTRRTCSAAVLAVQPIRPAWCEGKFCSQRIRPVPFLKFPERYLSDSGPTAESSMATRRMPAMSGSRCFRANYLRRIDCKHQRVPILTSSVRIHTVK